MKLVGKVLSINCSTEKGVVKLPQPHGFFEKNFGLVGDAHGGDGVRQVSLLAVESIHKVEEKIERTLPHGSFAENITTQGVSLHTLPIGTLFQIGDTLQQISQIGKQCHVGCAVSQQVGKCIMPVEGIFTRVIRGGMIRVGDTIEILN